MQSIHLMKNEATRRKSDFLTKEATTNLRLLNESAQFSTEDC